MFTHVMKHSEKSMYTLNRLFHGMQQFYGMSPERCEGKENGGISYALVLIVSMPVVGNGLGCTLQNGAVKTNPGYNSCAENG